MSVRERGGGEREGGREGGRERERERKFNKNFLKTLTCLFTRDIDTEQ